MIVAAIVTIAIFAIAFGLTLKSKPTQEELRIGRYVGAVLMAAGLLLVWWSRG